jgi:hypothetical protein
MMNTFSRKRFGPVAAVLLSLTLFLSACGGSGSSAVPYDDSLLLNVTPAGSSSINYNLWDLIDTLPYEPLSAAEQAALAFMREEEKLARDVYLDMYDLWGQQIFVNIAESEQTHTDTVLRLLQKYSLADPAEGKLRGEFADPNLQGLYDYLVAQGNASLIDALIVGATIEDLDIFDLHRQLGVVDNQDITVAFDNLQLGSRNHLRAFYGRLDDMNIVYTPVYISQQEYDQIVNSPMESGR